ncbi:phage tail protein [Photobacterium leiognathi]|uniref:phage tail protein n=1 Tax=Photobacterium leiognathi TaxID=553611 RepID=UPI00020880D8|nr:phage tail protein [Photobacterium leiognathi]GAA03240.1 phage P2 GpU family protein [Photobacterium leiognathi subsp. mandapamensis svers.1.1.]
MNAFSSFSRGVLSALSSDDSNTTTNDIMMTLGTFKFSITTAAYQELVKSYSWEWSEVPLFGQYDQLHFTGPKNPTIKLSGLIYTEFENVGVKQVDKLKAQGDQGKPLLLTSGMGEVLGYWVMTAVSETQSGYRQHGVTKKQTFTVELKFYGKKLSDL